jgi:hypothetical protein
MNKVYTEQQINFIKDNAGSMKDRELTQAFNKTFNKNASFATIRKMRQRLGIVKKQGRPRLQ